MKMKLHDVVSTSDKTRLDKKREGQPQIEVNDLDDVYIRSMYFENVGEANIPHKPPYAHYTLLASGSCEAEIDGVKTTHIAPAILFTPAHVLHYFTALESNTALHCINVLHDGVPVVV